ncbi:hypothetical protein SAMN05216474_2303 [Lishizhenia tianjinensis]|uniref:Lipoprotein n=1 Tax=Lishizhenia tianjinensis TaxID=477690 RepID=A0A1I7AQ51_9FLAO|nr:hypothetical protein [Lishizhenia tianjinensis]SFT77037.1 hypothetical protein SAMN05216474_2303 [Lishizhenia tianjinensis]
MIINFKNYGLYTLLYFLFTITSCSSIEKDNVNTYSKIEMYTKENYKNRVESFISTFEYAPKYALIDYGNCAQCSQGFIDNFFMVLPKNEEIRVIFNDSSVYFKFHEAFPKLLWDYSKLENWKKNNIESSKILYYEQLESGGLRLLN